MKCNGHVAGSDERTRMCACACCHNVPASMRTLGFPVHENTPGI